MNHAAPRRLDWARVVGCALIVASGVVMAGVLGGLAWLALAVLGGPV